MAGKGVQQQEPPTLKPGAYSDGHPLDTVHYLESKLILKPERFTSPPTFHEFGKLVGRAAEELEVGFSTRDYKGARPRIREVVFLDTKDFSLYNNSFILRRRISYEDGFAVGNPEIVFKFRHPDLQTAAEMDVRPNIQSDYRIKFKAEALPLQEKLGGYRLLYSHNTEFELIGDVGRTSIRELAEFFPALAGFRKSNKKVDLVNHTIVEEVLQDLGVLDFGKGVVAKSNAALWRERGDHKMLVGEFSFECKFKRRDDLHEKALERVRRLFIRLQEVAADWISLGTTKTGIVYRLKGNPPQSHE
ncbi:MAG TPA: hypothetical protein VMI09_01695 [Candidatus Binataceae bacterium]|nr:hypothetical protein [Candidatus Binataceae bacterium]